VREKGVRFELEDASSHFGTLKISDNCTLWLVDGQHRLYGIRKAAERGLEDFFVPTVIINPASWDNVDDPRYEEAAQFLTINRTQKGVRPDLAERFLGELLRKESPPKIKSLPTEVTRGISWRPKAQAVCDWLNKNCHVWNGKIRLPNEPRNGTIVSQKAITDSIEPILRNENFTVYEADELAKMLSNYWVAISELCQKAFATPQEYVIQKTTGVIVLHRLFAAIALRCSQNLLTPDNFKKVLSQIPSINDDFWHSKGQAGLVGTGGKSQDILAGKLRDEIEGISPEQPKKVFAM
jgi:DGQHR domain-containing protein